MIASRVPVLTLVVLVAAGVSACGGNEADTDESGEETVIVEPVPVVEAPPAPPPDRNPDGSLIESDDYVGGLRLPRGLREVAVNERQHYYEGPYVPEAYVNYFGPRLLTGQVTQLPGGGARYGEATAREARGGVVVMDVLISPGASGTSLVTIDERPPVPTDPPSEEEIFRELRRQQQEEFGQEP
ncbi:MAG: hypothetical protein J0L92_21835 [Deltaproteobacteria bacterium]|nr:hypothetical protein [Deltaproteobacteria bacterium]